MSAFAAVSCSLVEIEDGRSGNGVSGGVWGGPLEDVGSENVARQVCYVTAFDYQKGYDWRTDQARESVRCSLVVYADGKPIMKVPVGEQYEIGSDPDMHRMISGHLYTDYSTAEETVVRKDGLQIFRYIGREAVCGMSVVGEDVYTIGQSRSGDGFSYRKNGEAIFAKESGVLMGTLRNIDDSLSFAYYDNIHSSEGNLERYYVVRNGKVRQVAVREDIRKVWDIVCTKDEVIYLASVTGVSAPVLFQGEKMTAMPLSADAKIMSSSIHYSEGQLGVEMTYRIGADICTSLWMNGVVLKVLGKGMMVSSVCLIENGLCFTSNPMTAMSQGMIFRSGDQYPMPQWYSCMGNGAMSMVNGILHVGLSSTIGGRPLVWKDGQTDTLQINGYISSVSAM